jgi:hypothetical protein
VTFAYPREPTATQGILAQLEQFIDLLIHSNPAFCYE